MEISWHWHWLSVISKWSYPTKQAQITSWNGLSRYHCWQGIRIHVQHWRLLHQGQVSLHRAPVAFLRGRAFPLSAGQLQGEMISMEAKTIWLPLPVGKRMASRQSCSGNVNFRFVNVESADWFPVLILGERWTPVLQRIILLLEAWTLSLLLVKMRVWTIFIGTTNWNITVAIVDWSVSQIIINPLRLFFYVARCMDFNRFFS